MPQQVLSNVENNFTKGLVTEFTGLNFPENASTDSDNTTYTIVGDVVRRAGIDNELNGVSNSVNRTGGAISAYKWNNVGGDGLTQVVVEQVGGMLYFYRSSSATVTSPVSTTLLSSTINIASFVASGVTFDSTLECQFSDGNGYLFVYHPNCDPFYCTYIAGSITANTITIQVRDFTGVPETIPVNVRPGSLNPEHAYNLANQGWVIGNSWNAISNTTLSNSFGDKTFAVQSGLTGITNGQLVVVYYTGPGIINYLTDGITMSGSVLSYTGNQLTIRVSSVNQTGGAVGSSWSIFPTSVGYVNTWNGAIGNYPSNADVWWYFKDATGVFNPASTINNVTLAQGNAPKGHFVLNAFNQNRSGLSGQAITTISTNARPKTGCWYQGRVWYTGVDAQQPASGDVNYYTWTENIYFSQIITDASQFGNCYQVNDPTSETLFGLLPSDGGVINIQGSGSIYKLFPMQNAMLVFAANGVWYITGSNGIGFSANDYTIVKLSAVRSISSTSFVDINGLPLFWNEEGIYSVEGAKQGTSLLNTPLHVNPLEVIPITVGTILSFYNSIPTSSKKYARGAYDPIEYTVQWVYRDTEATDVTSRYTFNKILNYNTYNKAFFPFTIDTSNSSFPSINGIVYVSSPGGLNTPESTIKYVSSLGNSMYFAEEYSPTYVDWSSVNGGNNYISTFTTGYKLHGQGERRFQVPYVYIYSRLNQLPASYYIQSLWDYATSGDSGRWSTKQQININSPNFGMAFRRHRLRGQGLVLQIKVSSVDGQPFDIMGWATYETQNQSV